MIEFDGVSKEFKMYSSPAERLKEILFQKSRHSVYKALTDVSFSVNDGETLGIIGPNGAGKSTILKILMGILLPDSGSVRMSGRVTGLLELGTGFNAEMSGHQNIFMNGLLLGMTKTELENKKDAIIDFSELGDFIKEPLKTYSSGMIMRLAFSIAIHASPSCFLVDEALSVGDAHFSQKCMTAIREFRKQGGSIVFVSHDLNAVKTLCDGAILLDKGKMLKVGDPETVVNSYNYLVAAMGDPETENRMKLQTAEDISSYGNMDMVIESVEVLGRDSKSCVMSSGEMTDIIINFHAGTDCDELAVGVMLRDRFGQDIFGTNTVMHKMSLSVRKGADYTCVFSMPMNIYPGKYSVTAALTVEESRDYKCFNWRNNMTDFIVAGMRGPLFAGTTRLETEISFDEKRP
jgi:lipopolysaccharide transport system ATP-binding protein